jgi:hypothetical protein
MCDNMLLAMMRYALADHVESDDAFPDNPGWTKDGNGYPISVCPRISDPMNIDLGVSLYPRAWVRAANKICK